MIKNGHTDGKLYQFCRKCGRHLPIEAKDFSACTGYGVAGDKVKAHDYVPCPQNGSASNG